VQYLTIQGAGIHSKDKDNRTPLHYAAEKGHLSVVEYLVNQKADLNDKDNDTNIMYLIAPLFIRLYGKIIFVLLNI